MERDLKKIVSEMTLEEKAGMCSGLDFWHLERSGTSGNSKGDGQRRASRAAQTG